MIHTRRASYTKLSHSTKLTSCRQRIQTVEVRKPENKGKIKRIQHCTQLVTQLHSGTGTAEPWSITSVQSVTYIKGMIQRKMQSGDEQQNASIEQFQEP